MRKTFSHNKMHNKLKKYISGFSTFTIQNNEKLNIIYDDIGFRIAWCFSLKTVAFGCFISYESIDFANNTEHWVCWVPVFRNRDSRVWDNFHFTASKHICILHNTHSFILHAKDVWVKNKKSSLFLLVYHIWSNLIEFMVRQILICWF